LRLRDFLIGDRAELTAFGEQVATLPAANRYILVDSEGEGRVLAAPPEWRRGNGWTEVEVEVEPRFPRIRAQDLAEDTDVLDDSNREGRVAGLARLPQHVQMVLATCTGWGEDKPNRLAEYYALFGGTTWLPLLLKLEAIRLASIPDRFLQKDYTLFQCVQRVLSVELFAAAPDAKHFLKAKMTLDVVGVGSWSTAVDLYVGEFPALPSVEEMMAESLSRLSPKS